MLVDPLDRLSRFRFDNAPLLRSYGEARESFGKLERDPHEWSGDEESNGNVEEMEEA